MKYTRNLRRAGFIILFCMTANVLLAQRYVFFLHNKFIEGHAPEEAHPDYGVAEYNEILDFFTAQNFVVVSEKRPKDTDVKIYAQKVAGQIDSLLKRHVRASQITVIGTSKGGYIAQYVSSQLKNKDLNYVFIGCCAEEDVSGAPDINFCGNVLSIYEKSDSLAQSCQNMKVRSSNVVGRFSEIELNTGLKHGFLFKALPEWLIPSAAWARQEYGENKELHVKTDSEAGLSESLDALLLAPNAKPFNGVVLVAKDGFTKYVKRVGYTDSLKKRPFKFDDQFVVGSISKQFTAVLLLREYEKGKVSLQAPIKTYLPEMSQSWADSVSVEQLLTHMHGIVSLNKPLAFAPGTKFSYSQIGYELLARIIEKTSGKLFAEQSEALFRLCKMRNTFHPGSRKYRHLVQGFTEQENGKLTLEKGTFENYVAAGSFISTANDLLLWNESLHGGKLLSSKTYALMTAPKVGAERNHPIFGLTNYGYGITVDNRGEILQLGQTGFSPGFVSMDFYFPKTKTSVIVLDNTVWDESNLKKTFRYHTGVLEIVRKSKLVKKE